MFEYKIIQQYGKEDFDTECSVMAEHGWSPTFAPQIVVVDIENIENTPNPGLVYCQQWFRFIERVEGE